MAEQILNSVNDFNELPSPNLAARKTVDSKIAYSVTNPEDMMMNIQPDPQNLHQTAAFTS
ncbi:MAG: hypothetical protein CMH41_10160 [Micrococcales bacterium]|nr:hypothetical protein [Micrococcales bacterium]